MDHYFELKTRLGEYYAIESELDYLPSQGYAACFNSISTMDFRWNDLNAIFYHNRNDEDITMNGWTFSNIISGRHRIYNQIPPNSPEFTIHALDPNQHMWELEVHTEGFLKEAAADYMNIIVFISKFPNRELADAFFRIRDWQANDESTELLTSVKEIREYFQERYEEGNDELFWDKVKTTLNKAIEDYKTFLDSLKL